MRTRSSAPKSNPTSLRSRSCSASRSSGHESPISDTMHRLRLAPRGADSLLALEGVGVSGEGANARADPGGQGHTRVHRTGLPALHRTSDAVARTDVGRGGNRRRDPATAEAPRERDTPASPAVSRLPRAKSCSLVDRDVHRTRVRPERPPVPSCEASDAAESGDSRHEVELRRPGEPYLVRVERHVLP